MCCFQKDLVFCFSCLTCAACVVAGVSRVFLCVLIGNLLSYGL